MFRKNFTLSPEVLFKITKDLARQHKTIGFTHGAFDLFHIGHLSFLQESSSKCDFLVVCIESDKNIVDYKNAKRPIIKERNRLKIINELNCIDAVFINPFKAKKEKYIELYKNLHTNYVFIGNEFGQEENVFKQAYAANVKVNRCLSSKRFCSTTSIIDSILKKYSQGTRK